MFGGMVERLRVLTRAERVMGSCRGGGLCTQQTVATSLLTPLAPCPATQAAAPAPAPAMKDTTGFLVPDALMNSAASSSAVPPISPIMMMPSVWGVGGGGWGGRGRGGMGGEEGRGAVLGLPVSRGTT